LNISLITIGAGQSFIFCLTWQKFIPIHSPDIEKNLLGQKKEQEMGINTNEH